MPSDLHAALFHFSSWTSLLIVVCAVSLFALWIASIVQRYRLHLVRDRQFGGAQAGLAESTAAWADINEDADRTLSSIEAECDR